MSDHTGGENDRKPFPDLRQTSSMTLAQAAEFYALAGICVIALEPGGKVPHHELRKGWPARATNDVATVRAWWTQWPEANIGMVLGERSKLIALDLDNKDNKADGVEAFAGLHENAGGPSATTPNRGIHRLFQYEHDLHNKSPRKGGFDLLIRNKQIVVAPSRVKNESGDIVQYRWTNGGEPAPLPKKVRDKIDEIVNRRVVGELDPNNAPATPPLGNIVPHEFEVMTDDRSDGAFRLALDLFRSTHGITASDVLATLWDVPDFHEAAMQRRGDADRALDWLWQYCVYPATGVQVHFPTDSSYDPRKEPTAPWEADVRVDPMAEVDVSSSLSDLMRAYASPPEYVIPHWLPKGVLTTLFGEDGTGKTLFVQRMCTCLAAGRRVLSREAGRPVKSLMLLTEDTMPAIVDRQRRVCTELEVLAREVDPYLIIPNDLMNVDVKLVTYDRNDNHTLSPFAQWVIDYLEKHPDIELLVLDPISDIFADEENVRQRVSLFMRQLNMIAHKFDIAVLLIGHPAKAAGSEYSGSTAWSSKSRSRWFMKRKSKSTRSPVELIHHKASYGPNGDDTTLVWTDYGTLRDLAPSDSVAAARAELEAFETHVLEFLIKTYARTGEVFHMSANAPNTYLPKVMMDREESGGLANETEIASAIQRLASRGSINLQTTFDGIDSGVPRALKANRLPQKGVWPAPKFRPVLKDDAMDAAVEIREGAAYKQPNRAGVVPKETDKFKEEHGGKYEW